MPLAEKHILQSALVRMQSSGLDRINYCRPTPSSWRQKPHPERKPITASARSASFTPAVLNPNGSWLFAFQYKERYQQVWPWFCCTGGYARRQRGGGGILSVTDWGVSSTSKPHPHSEGGAPSPEGPALKERAHTPNPHSIMFASAVQMFGQHSRAAKTGCRSPK